VGASRNTGPGGGLRAGVSGEDDRPADRCGARQNTQQSLQGSHDSSIEGQAAAQLSKAALHADTAAVCAAAHACTQAGRFVVQAATHPWSVAAAAVTQLPIPWAQAATQAAEGGRVWAPAFRTGTTIPPIDAAHART